MAVRLRVILSVFLVTAAVVVASTLAIWGRRSCFSIVHVREQVRRDTIARIEQLESVVKDAETGQRGFVITGDESYLEPFDQAIKRLPADLEQLVQAPGALLEGGRDRESEAIDRAKNGGVAFHH